MIHYCLMRAAIAFFAFIDVYAATPSFCCRFAFTAITGWLPSYDRRRRFPRHASDT